MTTQADRFVDAVLTILSKSIYWNNEKTGETFQGITETDLMRDLRDRGWRLPNPGYFHSEMIRAGFRSLQPYKDGDLRPVRGSTWRTDPTYGETTRKERKLNPYNTLYTL